jgi:hypothetical protein
MDLSVQCPYCRVQVQTDLEAQDWSKNAAEILTVPLMERLGRLASTTAWVSKGKDPRLGGILSIWNNTVGLLRGYQQDVHVMKREIRCDSQNCGAAFDCYVNLDPEHKFSDFWPHLTGKVDAAGQYSSSGAQSSAERLLTFGENIGVNPNSFTIILGFGFCLLTLLPNILLDAQQSELLDQAILRFGVVLLVAMMLWTIKQTSEHIRDSLPSLRDLLIIPNHNSLQFWHNFALGRVTGVSFPKEGRKSHFIQPRTPFRKFFSKFTISQAAVVGGIPSLLLATIIWATRYLPNIREVNLLVLSEFIFWIVITYFTGVSAWIGLNVGAFLLQNISFIPMKLTPFNGFDNLAPVKKIAKLSLQLVIPVALLPLLVVVSLLTLPSLQALIQLWLLPWIQILLGLGLILIGLADTGILILGIIYVGLLPLISSTAGDPSAGWILGSRAWVGLGAFGAFLSILLAYHLSRAFVPLARIVKEKKQETIDQLNRTLVSLSDDLRNLENNLSHLSDFDTAQREAVLRNIKSITDLREKVISTRIDLFDIRTSIGVISPFLYSVVLPFVLEALKNRILPTK